VEEEVLNQDIKIVRERAKTPRAAAIAGILFSLLLITSLVLIRISVPADPQEAGSWLSSDWNAVGLALNLVPFAGIAFLWFIGVVRDRLAEQEDRFFSTIFLGSGLLFLAMLFAAAAVAGGVISLFGATPAVLAETGVYTFGRVLSYEIMNVYALKMAGVFMLSTCTISLRTGIFPRWMTYLGIALAVVLMLSLGRLALVWSPLVFPLWILLISVHILWENFKRQKGEQATPEPG
jgi:hypothetical protein